jgi:ATP:cob(I)alamin adenosyltransferase
MKLITRTGDGGATRLFDGSPVAKDDPRIETNGCLDELSSALGLGKALAPVSVRPELERLQILLVDLMAYVARGRREVPGPDPKALEAWAAELLGLVPVENRFVLPGETPAEGALHLARAVARRAERAALPLRRDGLVSPEAYSVLNRLSDLIFLLARRCAFESEVERITGRILAEVSRRSLSGLPRAAGAPLEGLGLPRSPMGGEIIHKEESSMKLTLATAQKLVAAMQAEAEIMKIPMVISVVDDGANLIALERMDGALLVSLKIAPNKAKTAVALQTSTDQLAAPSAPGGSLFGLGSDPEVIIFGGGFPLKVDGVIVGAVGVSGGSVEEDMRCAGAGVACFEKL